MAKIRISATIDPETNKLLDKVIKKGKYRNKSHILEEAIKKFSKEEVNDK